jgi:hypothetical protein
MTPLPAWVLPGLLLVVWLLWVLACAAGVAAEDVRRGTLLEHRRGVSILPAFPLFPLLFWGVALVGDVWVAPWGTLVVGTLHVGFAIVLLVSLFRDWRYCSRESSA